MESVLLDIAASLLVLTALLSYANQRWLKLPTTIGVMATSLALSLALVALDAVGLSAGAACARAGADPVHRLLRAADAGHAVAAAVRRRAARRREPRCATTAGRWRCWRSSARRLSTLSSASRCGWRSAPSGLPVPLLDCLLFGALISPTDPIAVIGMLKSAGAPRNLEVVIAGESLFNDGVGVVHLHAAAGHGARRRHAHRGPRRRCCCCRRPAAACCSAGCWATARTGCCAASTTTRSRCC